jgi:hypothetical protein
MAEHHYIPEFYLKGFTSADTETFYIYDIKKGRLKSKPHTAGSHFFDINRNTVTHDGLDTDLPEKLYGLFENDEAKLFKRLKNENKPLLDYQDMLILCRFLAVLYIRLPAFDKLYEYYYATNDLQTLGISLRNQYGNDAPKEITDEIRNTELLKAGFRSSLGLNLLYNTAIKDDFKNWFILPTKKPSLISDNPIFSKKDQSL